MNLDMLKVKDALKNEKIVDAISKYAPDLLKNPAVKLLGGKTCKQVLDLAVSKGFISAEQAKDIEAEANKLLGE